MSRFRDKWWYKFDIVSMIDPASSQEGRNCESAIVTVAGEHKTKRSEIYVLDARCGHWKDTEVLNQMYMLHELYEPDHIGIESVAFQQTFVTLTEMSTDRPAGFSLTPHSSMVHGRKKRHRLVKAANYIHLVRFLRGDEVQNRLIDQLVTFQGKSSDRFDLGDAFCMAINEYMRLYPPGYESKSVKKFDYIYRHGQIIGHRPI